MRKKNYYILLFFIASALVACENSESDSSTGKSKIMLSILSDVTYPSSNSKTRALDLTPYKDVKNYTVEILNTNGDILQSKPYGDMDLVQEIEPGTYSIRAFYGENPNVGYDKLYVEGSQKFEVVKGDTKKITFACVPANAKIKISYSDDFFNYYSDCVVDFQTKYLETPFSVNKEDIDKELFFKTDSNGESLTVSFLLKDIKGVNITPDNFKPQTLKINPRDFLTISVKPKLVNIDGGKITGITVTVDNGTIEENIEVVIPDEFMPGNDIEVNN